MKSTHELRTYVHANVYIDTGSGSALIFASKTIAKHKFRVLTNDICTATSDTRFYPVVNCILFHVIKASVLHVQCSDAMLCLCTSVAMEGELEMLSPRYEKLGHVIQRNERFL